MSRRQVKVAASARRAISPCPGVSAIYGSAAGLRVVVAPPFFVSVASKGLRDSTSPLESVLTDVGVSVAFKGLTGRDNSALPVWS